MNPRHHFFVLIATAVIGLQAYAQQEEPEKPYLDFWRNWLTPQQYAVQLNYVQNQMKDESEVERNFKGRRREVFAAERWVGIGPSHVKRTDPNLSFYGRIRVIHRFYNPIYSRWELYCGASSGGLWYADADSPPPLVNWISLG
ncbi:MAG TPA: hypothetical protein VGR15_01740, partial [Bacteroidota bacterium]|nr:hypothetical protein [Bacteroidota bacterium]